MIHWSAGEDGMRAPDIGRQHLAGLLFWAVAATFFAAALLPLLALIQNDGRFSISWFHSNYRSFHAGHLWIHGLLLIAFLLASEKIRDWCDRIAGWLYTKPHDPSRWTLVSVPLCIFFVVSLHGHSIFMHRGVPGWTYAHLAPKQERQELRSIEAGFDTSAATQALNREPLRFFTARRVATADMMFLHFRDGSMRAGNLALSGLSWTIPSFPWKEGLVSHGDKFLELVRHNLERRRNGLQVALPASLSYPTHINYQPLDVRGYPPASDLKSISFWRVAVEIDPANATLTVIGAREIARTSR